MNMMAHAQSISVLQAVTQINEVTLTFVPKIAAMVVAAARGGDGQVVRVRGVGVREGTKALRYGGTEGIRTAIGRSRLASDMERACAGAS